ncbi:TetR family transcriptional regulator [Acrocarpospora pleiomorpha]|uniref:TetR family transcriptional regulator n=1 Tax=Acrocarpospora pleiomorpha TaxID=90975 RepID=A0A5M3XVX2_9ACTN|nr:TetR/AcrR family transcriptional regulator [Acrocarpospora pleiomorpha]GES25324.1 TetR family transcriptional regulator [Acrocarpospora pleiomorpha]
MALGLFCRKGFEEATFDDLAAAAGVSRSTFLRYFGTKEDVVLGALDPLGDRKADALRARPADEDDWTALRRTVDPDIEYFSRDPADSLVLLRLTQTTPALCSRLREKQASWRPGLVKILTARATDSTLLASHVRVAAALDCLNIALEHWVATDGRIPLATITDEAFAALTTP